MAKSGSVNRCFFFLLLPMLLCFASCADDERMATYSVDPELDNYLQRFLTSARQHGKNYDLERDGIIMEFADLPYPKIGLCHFTDPIKVQIDRTFWRGTKGKADQENQRENTVFHELGHGLLRRQHVNTTAPDMEWKSLMCGGEQVGDRAWFVNFTGKRREYYLDELFDPTTPAPSFMKMEKVELDRRNVLYDMELNRPLELSNPNTYGSLNLLLERDFGSDFYAEAEVEISSSVGLFVGADGAFSYFDLTSSGRAILANTACYEPFAEVFLPDSLVLSGRVRLGVLSRGDELSFFVDGLRFYWNDFPLEGYQKMGLSLPANGQTRLHSFVVYGE